MPIPLNITAATAIDITALPYNNIQDVLDTGITYTVWYKYTATFTGELGLWGFGSLIGYKPTVNVFSPNPTTSYLLIGAQNVPVQIPVVNGITYWFRFTKNGNFNPSILTVDALRFTNLVAPLGSLIINDDTPGFPAAIRSAVNGSLLRFVYPFPAGEQGDSLLSTGKVIVTDEFVDFDFKLYDNQLNFIQNLGWPDVLGAGSPLVRACQGANKWYLSYTGSGGNPALTRSCDNNGNLGPIINISSIDGILSGLTAVAAKDDESILYYSGRSSSLNSQIKRLDLNTLLPLSDLIADVGGGYRVIDILYLSDNTLIVLYVQNSPTFDVFIRHYNATTGATLNTFTGLGSTTPAIDPRITYALDNPNSFWFFGHDAGKTILKNIRTLDGVYLVNEIEQEYSAGKYNSSETATPDRFGNSACCPIIVLPATIGGSTTGTIQVIKLTNPSGAPNIFTINALGGLTPNSLALKDTELYTYENVPVGIYGFSEIVPAGWSVAYSVSDGSPINAINLQADEFIVIIITNTLIPNLSSGIYKVVPNKRQDTLWLENFTGTRDVKIP